MIGLFVLVLFAFDSTIPPSDYNPVIQPLGIRPSGITITELAEMAGMTKQGKGQLVNDLEEKGYAVKERSEFDRRAWNVRLTVKGLEMQECLYSIFTY